MQSLLENRKKKRKALFRPICVSLFFNLIPFFIFGRFSLSLALISGMMVYRQFLQSAYITIWFRRFNKHDIKLSKFNLYLINATRGLCSNITLQDSSYRSSFIFTEFQLYFIFLLAVLVPCAFSTLITFEVTQLLDLAHYFKSVFIITMIFSLSFSIWLCYRYFQYHGFFKLKEKTILQDINNVLRKAKKRGAVTGIYILRSGDEYWQQSVKYLLQFANAAVIDGDFKTFGQSFQ